ncbi:MAG: hypothetical protein P8I27_00145 [Pirellulaceae bacterium]|nr:hypothetical protein [Planctomycetaceae bacterium]MDG1806278.1 hypothetical protein [Pirellulaceae bacterium]
MSKERVIIGEPDSRSGLKENSMEPLKRCSLSSPFPFGSLGCSSNSKNKWISKTPSNNPCHLELSAWKTENDRLQMATPSGDVNPQMGHKN